MRIRCRSLSLFTGILIMLSTVASSAQTTAKSANVCKFMRLPQEQQQKEIVRLNAIDKQARDFEKQELFHRAVEAETVLMTSERELFGDESEEFLTALTRLANLQEENSDYKSAEAEFTEVLDKRILKNGRDNWQTVDAKDDLADLKQLKTFSGTQQHKLNESNKLDNQAFAAYRDGNLIEAISIIKRVLAIRRSVLGTRHRATASTLKNLAGFQKLAEEYDDAQSNLVIALSIELEVHGVRHPATAAVLNNLAAVYDDRSDYATAKPLYLWAIAIHKETSGARHAETARVLNNLGHMLWLAGEYKSAINYLEEALAIHKELFGDTNIDTALSYLAVGQVEKSLGQYSAARKRFGLALELAKQVPPSNAVSINLGHIYESLGVLCIDTAEFPLAQDYLEKTLAIRTKTSGSMSAAMARALSNLAVVAIKRGNYVTAKDYAERALLIYSQRFGSDSPQTAGVLNIQGSIAKAAGDYPTAKSHFEHALAISKMRPGQKHPLTATYLNNLGDVLDAMGDVESAKRCYEEALDINKEVLGSRHPDTASSLNILGLLLKSLGDYPAAFENFKQALSIQEEVFDKPHPYKANTLANIGSLLCSSGDYPAAKTYLERAVAIDEQCYGPKGIETLRKINSLGDVLLSLNDNATAKLCFERVINTLNETSTSDRRDMTMSLNNLGRLLTKTGEFIAARQCFEKALAIPGTTQINTAYLRNNLAFVYREMEDESSAGRELKKAVTIENENLRQLSVVLSERQQRHAAETSPIFTHYIDWAVQGGSKTRVPEVYEEIAMRKGAVYRRQLALSAIRGNPELQQPFVELQSVITQLAAAALLGPSSSISENTNAQKRIADLTHQKERLEIGLKRKSTLIEASLQTFKIREIQSIIPSNAILVDCYVHSRYIPAFKSKDKLQHWEDGIAAFVIGHSGEATLVDLGSLDDVQTSLAAWYGFKRSDLGRSAEAQNAARKLRQQLWLPLVSSIPKIEHQTPLVIISPDGPLCHVPWNALPGTAEKSYLINDVAICLIPTPQALPELIAGYKAPKGANVDMLLLGNVDYDHSVVLPSDAGSQCENRSGPELPFGSARRDAFDSKYSPLDGTKGELKAIADLGNKRFGESRVKILQGTEASKESLFVFSPHCKYIHLGTHGFFASAKYKAMLERPMTSDGIISADGMPQFDSSVGGWNPGLLSGIVLAGANLPPRRNMNGIPVDNGILTAEEVMALDLRGVELVTLSACESGLGQSERGEGLLGLQRAFQMSGARTTVSSLWKVPDKATEYLMVRFYTNLWRTDNGTASSKINALRDAQLWMLQHAMKEPDISRGLKPLPGENEDGTAQQLPPYYWSAFQLSGDWR